MDSCIICIPAYKNEPTEEEKFSFLNCLTVLCKYDICIIHPSKLNLFHYNNLSEQTGKQIRFISFEDNYFQNINGYNKLLLNPSFYLLFKSYKYMLIHQLDAYIFHDNIDFWIKKNYDYIGAPWVNWFWTEFYARHITFQRRILYKLGKRNFNLVGNGGFSLRKISSTICNLNLLKGHLRNFDKNEDLFFSYYINSYNPFFKVAPFNEAIKFAFDELPNELFTLNNSELPMACHAWPKYYDSFWKQFINFEFYKS